MAIFNRFFVCLPGRVVGDMAKAHLPFTEDTEAQLARDHGIPRFCTCEISTWGPWGYDMIPTLTKWDFM